MPNQNNTQKPQVPQSLLLVKNYDAGDLWDALATAESDLNWCSTAMGDLRIKFKQHKKYMMEAYGVHKAHFEQIETFIDMYEYLIESRLGYCSKEVEAYKQEYEANKKEGEK